MVGDIRLYRDGLAALLDREAGLSVVGTAATQDEAVEQVVSIPADVALIDMAMAGSMGTARALTRIAPLTPIIALAVPENESNVIACAEAGIVAYVAREATLPDLVGAIEGAARGEAQCSPRVAGGLLRRIGALSRERAADEACARLTARELEIVSLIDRGLSNKQIASALFIELPTVKNHVHHILEKLGVERRAEAAARVRAMRRGSGTAA